MRAKLIREYLLAEKAFCQCRKRGDSPVSTNTRIIHERMLECWNNLIKYDREAVIGVFNAGISRYHWDEEEWDLCLPRVLQILQLHEEEP